MTTKLALFTAALGLLLTISTAAMAQVWVNPYDRNDGTRVEGYNRTYPDSNPYNNYSSNRSSSNSYNSSYQSRNTNPYQTGNGSYNSNYATGTGLRTPGY